MRIAREEIFGPVAGVIRAKDYEEALAISNDTEFGLASGICTVSSLKYASHYKRNSESGMVMVNCRPPASTTTRRSAAAKARATARANRAPMRASSTPR